MPSFFLRLFLQPAEDHNLKPSFRLCFAEPHIEADPAGTADRAAGIPAGQAADIVFEPAVGTVVQPVADIEAALFVDTEVEPVAGIAAEPVAGIAAEPAVEIAADTVDSSAPVLLAEMKAVQVLGRAQVPEKEREPQLQE